MEIWKDVNIDGFRDFYQVSNLGRVKSKPKVVYKKNNLGEKLVPHSFEEKIRKQVLSKDGYCIVGLYLNQIERKFKVHRLVAITFLGLPPSISHQVNHKDANKLNNTPENLEWVTHKENLNHSNENRLRGQKEILQIDLNGNILKKWKDLTEIHTELKYDKSAIVRVCREKAHKVYGFKWKYA